MMVLVTTNQFTDLVSPRERIRFWSNKYFTPRRSQIKTKTKLTISFILETEYVSWG
ncbi:hypothetical protein [Serratia marcescens]|uniref:hypothetical protein n=1 Tax=Serratia marcescens TaxID=615 RepID=UPI003D787CEA